MPLVADIVSAQQSRAFFLSPVCTRPVPVPGGVLPEPWEIPHGSSDRPVLPNDVVRKVRGWSVHCIDGEDYLSTSTVLSIMRWGDLSHVPPYPLEYGRMRGSYVDQACRCWDAGCLDWDALDDKLKPYVMAWRNFREFETDWTHEETEALVMNPWSRTFGYRDRTGTWNETPCVLDLKTSKTIGTSIWLQLASYLTGPRDVACAVQLLASGRYELHWLPNPMLWRKRFDRLAFEAHEYLIEEEQRA
jgi:hypothetical protein